jgi:hypothetical protein
MLVNFSASATNRAGSLELKIRTIVLPLGRMAQECITMQDESLSFSCRKSAAKRAWM